jgi:ribonucleoside-diphosphate reductase alpha chain
MTSVISKDQKSEGVSERPQQVVVNHAPKRPVELPCDIYTTQIKGNKWTVVVGKLDGYPFEMFAGQYSEKLPQTGTIRKVKSKQYILEGEGMEPLDLLATFGEHGTYAYSKMLSHGVPLFGIIDMCDKMLENILGFNKAMGRILKNYLKTEEINYMKCTSCQSTQLSFREGCIVCLDCGYSKCG